jgi:hypothetical protein
MPDLLQGRHTRVPMGLGDPRLLGRQVEIFSIGVRNPGLVPWLTGEPDEEPLQGRERGVERRLAQVCLRRLIGLTVLSRDEMRLAGYPDSTPAIDICAGID